jgi:putative intracellular protease/amidase
MAQIAFILVDPFADWEMAQVAPAAREFGDAVCYFTPGGQPVMSMGGLRVEADGKLEQFDPMSADALLLIGSPTWMTAQSPDVGNIVCCALQAGLLVGGICGGTLPLARAGLLDERAHTGNSLDELKGLGGAYAGAARYQDGPRAVIDRGVVTASGLAPVSFASTVLRHLHPLRGSELDEFEGYFARELQSLPS